MSLRTIGQMFVTLSLIIVLSMLIRNDYAKVKDALWPDFKRVFKKVDPENVKVRAAMTSLDTYRPDSFDILFKIADVPLEERTFALREHVDYYEKVLRYRPRQMEAYLMLGFCYYQTGRLEEAVIAYQRAVQLNPAFFWPYYNLGVIYFNAGEHKAAAEYFKRAVETDPKETLKIILSSHVFMEVLGRDQEVRQAIQGSLSGHYQKAYEALMLNVKLAASPQKKVPVQMGIRLW